MFENELSAIAGGAKGKYTLLKKNPLGYFLLSMLAGMFIGFGVLLAFTAGSLTSETPFSKIIMGCCFGIALSLVVIAGAELFTGNNMVMAVGISRKTVNVKESIILWIVCYLGNLAGSILLALIFIGCGLATGVTGDFIINAASTKMSMAPLALICRGILCNMLVCLAVWSGFRCKSESGKLIMIFWCLLAFITTGFEHSIANMTLLTVGVIADNFANLGGWFYNILLVTLGNMIGGIVFVAMPYLASTKKEKEISDLK